MKILNLVTALEFYFENDKDSKDFGEKIHHKLVGNKDYVNSNIVLNINTPKMVHLSYDESVSLGYINNILKQVKEEMGIE